MKPTCGNLVKGPDGTPAKYEDRRGARICGRVATIVWADAMNMCEACGSDLQKKFEASGNAFHFRKL